jgi:hypothetical protein
MHSTLILRRPLRTSSAVRVVAAKAAASQLAAATSHMVVAVRSLRMRWI